MNQHSLSYYLQKHAQGTLTDEERRVLAQMYHDPANAEELNKILEIDEGHWQALELDLPEGYGRIESALARRISEEKNLSVPTRSLSRVRSLRKWSWAAAILIIGITIGTVMYYERKSGTPAKEIASTQANIVPGSNKAILTLSNGQKVQLNSDTVATINDGKLAIKNKNGELSYNDSKEVVMNTMETPNGGQYQITLSDGTKVWLNAASSITYPTAFNGESRNVKITGEVYMEVAKDRKHPFIVDVAGTSKVEVLGTSFNINAYSDEGVIKTTLVEGSVRVGASGAVLAKNDIILKPGQQAIAATSTGGQAASGAGITVKDAVDIEQTLAWRNGLFDFSDADIKTIMRQIARWYNLEVAYEGNIPKREFSGKISRNTNLSDVLKILEQSSIHFRFENRKIIVTP